MAAVSASLEPPIARDVEARELLAVAIEKRSAAAQALEKTKTAYLRAKQTLVEAEEQYSRAQQELEAAAAAHASELAQRIRDGLEPSHRQFAEQALTAALHEAASILGTAQRVARAFAIEVADLQNSFNETATAVSAAVRRVVQMEVDRITAELENTMRRAATLRSQLRAIGGVRVGTQHAVEFSNSALSLIHKGPEQYDVQTLSREPWGDQIPAWDAFLRDLVEDAYAPLKF